ncbi:curli biogenesis system outer membrane secretion channel CsgG [Pseudomonas sp. TE12234]
MKSRVLVALTGIIAMLAVPLALAAGSLERVTVQTEGSGSSFGTATASALSSAVAQVNGAELASSTLSTELTQTLDTNAGSDFAAASATVEAIAQRTKGLVQSYRILSKAENAGIWTVSVEATISKYARSEQADRLRMTVLPFRSQGADHGNISDRFVMDLTTNLTSSRKFAMLDRAFEGERQSEMGVLSSEGTSMEEMAKLGNRLGTDYMIVGVIDDASIHTQSTELAGRTLTAKSATLSISYRVIDAPTGQIKMADSWTGAMPGGSVDGLAAKAAEAISRQIVDSIAPIKVESVLGDQLFLGQGGTSIKVGQRYRLLLAGDVIVDSYTKESLGRQEIEVGLIEIIDVQSKIAKAKVLKSNVNIAEKFPTSTFIVRLQSEAAKPVSAGASSKKSAPVTALKQKVESDW